MKKYVLTALMLALTQPSQATTITDEAAMQGYELSVSFKHKKPINAASKSIQLDSSTKEVEINHITYSLLLYPNIENSGGSSSQIPYIIYTPAERSWYHSLPFIDAPKPLEAISYFDDSVSHITSMIKYSDDTSTLNLSIDLSLENIIGFTEFEGSALPKVETRIKSFELNFPADADSFDCDTSQRFDKFPIKVCLRKLTEEESAKGDL